MHFIFQTQQSDLRHLQAKACEIVRPLTLDEADEEVGQMFKVRFDDGTEVDAFEDELTPNPRNLPELLRALEQASLAEAYAKARPASDIRGYVEAMIDAHNFRAVAAGLAA